MAFRLQGLGFRLQGLGFGVQVLGFRAQALRLKVWAPDMGPWAFQGKVRDPLRVCTGYIVGISESERQNLGYVTYVA